MIDTFATVLRDVNLLPVFSVSFLSSILIVTTKPLHLHRTAKGHAGSEIQSAHVNPTPRIGGLALFLGLLLAALMIKMSDQNLLGFALIAAIPVFFAGLMEDTGFSASPKMRLAAAMLSSLIMVGMTGYTINSGVAPGLDYLLDFVVLAALFTIFATAAVCHAFNLIDGMNGLATMIAIVAAVSLGAMAYQLGDRAVATMAFCVAISVLGVFLVNYPFGKLFLGDAGAYTVGFLIAWTGVMLIARNPDVSRWSVLLAVFWPFVDTTAAVLRRIVKKVPIGAPDKLHFHHVIMRAIEANLQDHVGKKYANPLTTLFLFPLVALPAVFGVLTARSNSLGFLCLLAGIAIYFALKIVIIRHFKKLARVSKKLQEVKQRGGEQPEVSDPSLQQYEETNTAADVTEIGPFVQPLASHKTKKTMDQDAEHVWNRRNTG